MLKDLLIPFAVVGGIGGFFGLMLGIAAKFWKVKKDERIDKILGCLPGANCGGCGYSGCGAYAEAVAKGEAPTNGCKVCAAEAVENISEIMGVEAGEVKRHVTCISCHGINAETRQEFMGALDCLSMAKLGGEKLCPYACIGLGTCVNACEEKGITIVNGVATINQDRCIACGKCVRSCPMHLLQIRPQGSVYVGCSSKDEGKKVRTYCDKGCIGCKICEKVCEAGAVKVINNIAVIDSSKCTECGKCIEKCPRKVLLRA